MEKIFCILIYQNIFINPQCFNMQNGMFLLKESFILKWLLKFLLCIFNTIVYKAIEIPVYFRFISFKSKINSHCHSNNILFLQLYFLPQKTPLIWDRNSNKTVLVNWKYWINMFQVFSDFQRILLRCCWQNSNQSETRAQTSKY